MKKMWSLVMVLVFVLSVLQFPAFAQETDQVVKPLILKLVIDPNPAIYGHRPVTAWARVRNPNLTFQVFQVEVWLGGPGWGGEVLPYSFSDGTWVTDIIAQEDWIKYEWVGGVDPQSVVWLRLPTFTGVQTGQFVFLKIDQLVGPGYPNHLEKMVTITEGTGELCALFSFTKGTIPYAGDTVGLQLVMTAPQLGQFYADEPFTSKCPSMSLPGGFYGHPQVTWEKFLWYIQLPDQPGRCNIKARIKVWNDPTQLVEVVFRFDVLPRP